MSTDPLERAIATFREWEGYEDDDHPGDELRVPLEEAIDAYLSALKETR